MSFPSKIRYLDGPRLRRSLLAACDYAQAQRAELNRINVFPVPDGDTGTNLALTVRAIADHLRDNRERTVAAVAQEAAQGAVLGARGNCGMMLSHFLLGFADHLTTRVRVTTEEFAAAMLAGVERLQRALDKPVEGTILTVMRDSATAARASGATDFVPFVHEVVCEARVSLERTPELLPVLAKSGVVDAGAKGFVSMLEGVLLFVEGDEALVAAQSNATTAQVMAAVAEIEYPADEEQYRYCTEALVRGAGLPSQSEVRAVLSRDGDSVIAIRADDILKIHVHTDHPEDVFAYLRSLGALVTHKAEDMRVQHATVGGAGHVQLARRPIAIVSDSACDLAEEIVRAHGIHVVPMTLVDGDATYRDGIDITADRFHEMLRQADPLPTTSQPTPASIQEGFTRAAEEGEVVVAVMVASTLSGTHRAARAVAAGFDDAPVHVVDSLGASLLQGMLTLKAAELGELGTPPEEIVRELDRIRARSGILFTVRTFDRLIASGRVGKGKALLGRFLGLRPILGLRPDGAVAAFGKAFGDKGAEPALLAALREQIPTEARKLRFGVVQVGLPEIVEPLTLRLREEYGDDVEVLSAPAASVISTHLGHGAWGIAYLVED